MIDGDIQIMYNDPGVERRERTLIKVVKGAIPTTVINSVQQAMATFKHGLCTDAYGNPKEPTKHERGGINSWSYHVGAWTPQGGADGIMPTASHWNIKGMPEFRKDLERSGFFGRVDNLFDSHFRPLQQRYKAVNGDCRAITKTFKTMAVNMEGISMPHIDSQDYGDGMCLVIPFGSYGGTTDDTTSGFLTLT